MITLHDTVCCTLEYAPAARKSAWLHHVLGQEASKGYYPNESNQGDYLPVAVLTVWGDCVHRVWGCPLIAFLVLQVCTDSFDDTCSVTRQFSQSTPFLWVILLWMLQGTGVFYGCVVLLCKDCTITFFLLIVLY